MTGRATLQFIRRLVRAAQVVIVFVMTAASFCAPLRAESTTAPADRVPIKITADLAQEWDDAEGHVSILRGRCRIEQGSTVLQARQMVIWRTTQSVGHGKRDHLVVYLEEDVLLEQPGLTLNDSPALFALTTKAGMKITIQKGITIKAGRDDALLKRAEGRRKKSNAQIIRTAQVTENPLEGPEIISQQFQPTPGKLRRIRIRPRSLNEFNIRSFRTPNRTPPEQVTIITGGVNIRIEGIEQNIQGKPVGTIDLSADRMVIWSRSEISGSTAEGSVQSQDEPLEVYMEGNIVIFQGDPLNPLLKREAHATAATFDARENKSLMLNAELKEYLPSMQANIRVWAERIQQLGPNAFHATHAWTTVSPYGKPGYRMQSTEVFLEERYQKSLLGITPTTIDPATGLPKPESSNWITGFNNVFLIEDLPVFYLPYMSVPADKSNVALETVLFTEDKIFGTQIRTSWDLMKLIGLQTPAGAHFHLLADYFSQRGPGAGLSGTYKGTDLFDVIPGKYTGEFQAYFIHDVGTDNLGSDRLSLIPATEDRGRLEWRDRQELPNGFTIIGEAGYLTDRNFLDEYYQWEFDKYKDVESLLYVKQQQQNWAWTATVRGEPNQFEYTAQWLPRGDLYVLSQSLLNGALTWSTHTTGSYVDMNIATKPTDPNDLFVPLPYYAPVNGAVFMTRHELDAPFRLGPVNFVPYVLGEAAYWGEGFDGSPINRFVGSAGIRSSIEASRAFPEIQSEIFNLNGLAHRVQFEATYAYTDSSRALSTIPQLNEFDDNAQERFRERLIVNTFGGVLPPQFDPRFYAVRTGAAYSVTAPYYELIDTQEVARLYLRQRLQTKYGPPDQQRIRDWMTLDLSASFFPDANRDNFGQEWGLLTANYTWNLSQRTSILANAMYDLFPGAEQIWNFGILSQRSERGSVYLGLYQIKGGGQLDSQILTTSYSYQMSQKWISTLGAAYDIGETRNAGESITITRVGLDFLVSVAAAYDPSSGNFGVGFSIEPRIGNLNNSLSQLGNLLGARH